MCFQYWLLIVMSLKRCKTAMEKSGYTIDQIRQKYQVTTEVEALLNAK